MRRLARSLCPAGGICVRGTQWASNASHILVRSFCTGAEASVRGNVDGNIGRITITNPAKRNAMNKLMYQQVPSAVAAAATADARVTIVAGEGTEAFGAGSDISEFAELRTGAAQMAAYAAAENAATAALLDVPHPLPGGRSNPIKIWTTPTAFVAGRPTLLYLFPKLRVLQHNLFLLRIPRDGPPPTAGAVFCTDWVHLLCFLHF